MYFINLKAISHFRRDFLNNFPFECDHIDRGHTSFWSLIAIFLGSWESVLLTSWMV